MTTQQIESRSTGAVMQQRSYTAREMSAQAHHFIELQNLMAHKAMMQASHLRKVADIAKGIGDHESAGYFEAWADDVDARIDRLTDAAILARTEGVRHA